MQARHWMELGVTSIATGQHRATQGSTGQHRACRGERSLSAGHLPQVNHTAPVYPHTLHCKNVYLNKCFSLAVRIKISFLYLKQKI